MRSPAPAPVLLTMFLGVLLVAGCASEAARSASGVAFRDPQGTYTMNVDADWTETTGTGIKEVEAWKVAPDNGGFANNVTVITQSTQGLDLAGYLTSSVHNIGAFVLVGQTLTNFMEGRWS
jgi:hypothetical protein